MDDIARLGYAIDSTQARTAAKDLDAMNASAGRAERGAVSLKRASQNLLRDEKGRFISAADSASKYGAEIESLRMKYNPLYAASMRFEAAQNEIKRALELGAITANQAKVAYAGLQSNMIGAAGATGAYSRAMSNANMHTANVFAQLNDIGVMMAAGQNPIQLALQQGTQLNQVWGQMGGNIRSVGSAIGGAFASMLNPLSLLTIGLIAGSAALVGWARDAFGAGNAAKTAAEYVDDLGASTSELKGMVKYFDVSGIQAMRDEYQGATEDVKRLIELQRQVEMLNAVEAARKSMQALISETDSFFAGAALNLDRLFNTIGTDFGFQLEKSMRAASEALSLEDQLAEVVKMREAIEATLKVTGNVTLEQSRFLASVTNTEAELRRVLKVQSDIEQAIANADAHQSNANQRIADAYGLYANTRMQAEGIVPAIVAADNATSALAKRVQFLSGVFGPAIASANALAVALSRAAGQIGAVANGMARVSALGRATTGVMGSLGKVFNADAIQGAAAGFGKAAERIKTEWKSAMLAVEAGGKMATSALVGGNGGGGGRRKGGVAGAVKDVADEMDEASQAAKAYADTMQKYVTDGIGKAVDWMVDGFKGGLKGIVDIFKDTIKQMISFALRNRIMIGLGLAPGAAMAGGSGGGIGGNLLGQIGGFGGSVISGASGLLTSLFGAGGGLGAAGTYLSATVGSAFSSIGAFGAALGSVLPIIGGVVAIGKALFGRKLKDTGITGTASAGGFDGGSYRFYKGGLLRSDKTKITPFDAEIDAVLDRTISGITSSVKDMGRALGLGVKSLRDFTKEIKFSTKDMSEDEALAELQRQLMAVGDDMAALVLGTKRYSIEGESALQTLERLTANLGAANTAFRVLGFSLFDATLKGAAGATRFIDALGGIDAMNSKVAFYFDTFYSETEKLSSIGKELRRGFRDAGVNRIPKTIEQYKRLVDRLQDAGKIGKVAKLIDMAPLFKQFEDLQDAIRSQRSAEREARIGERQGLLRQLYELQGKSGKIRKLEIQALDPANRKLQRRIWRLEREAAILEEREGLERRLLEALGDTVALQRLELQGTNAQNRALLSQIFAVELANEIANERVGLERELLELQGDTATLRKMELEALFPANRALQQQIWALQDQAEAADRARNALDALDMNDFASRLEFARAQGRSAAGLPVTNLGGSAVASTASTTTSGGDALASNAESIEQMRAALVSISTKVGYLLNIQRKWDVDGLPETRT